MPLQRVHYLNIKRWEYHEPDEVVHFFESVANFIVRIRRRHSELQYEPIDLVQYKSKGDSFLHCMLDGRLRIRHNAFDHVHDYDDAIYQSDSCSHFVDEVDVARGVDEMYKVRLAEGILQNEREG